MWKVTVWRREDQQRPTSEVPAEFLCLDLSFRNWRGLFLAVVFPCDLTAFGDIGTKTNARGNKHLLKNLSFHRTPFVMTRLAARS